MLTIYAPFNNPNSKAWEVFNGVEKTWPEKVTVKAEEAHPFYIWARENHGNSAIPKWNFHKIIIGKDGKVAETFSSITNPSSKKFTKALEDLLK